MVTVCGLVQAYITVRLGTLPFVFVSVSCLLVFCDFVIGLIRPPERQFGRPYILPQMFFFYFFRHAISELAQPIAAKLCHMIAILVRFIIQVQKFGGPSLQRNWGPKTCTIRRDFRQLSSLIANISGRVKICKIGKRTVSERFLPRSTKKVR